MLMTIAKKWILITVLAGSIVGGAVGGTLIGSGVGHAAGGTTTSTNSSTPNAASNGTFVPNENTSHEQGESAAREAQEDAGQVPTVP
jgi:hypothetical protein